MENGPELWNTILAQIPGGIIAGGCVRDYLMGVPAKDIDVFVSVHQSTNFNGWEPHPDAEEYEAGDHVAYVVQREVEGWTVDLIGMDPKVLTGEFVISQFDFGLTRCWYDGEIHDTVEAAHDREKGRITVMINDRPDRLLKRFERFNARNGGTWSLWENGAPYKPVIISATEEEFIF